MSGDGVEQGGHHPQVPGGAMVPPGYGPPPPGHPSSPPGYQGHPASQGHPQQQPPPGYRPVPPPGYGPLPRAAHKPGLLPLRPLRIGDVYDASFRLIRQNPGATVGASVLVAAVTMSLPVVTTLLLTLVTDTALPDDGSDAEVVALVGPMGSLLIGLLLLNLGTFLVTAMVSHVAMAGASGGRLGLGQAWALTRGHRWRTILLVGGLTVLGLLLLGLYVLLWVPVVLTEDWRLILGWALVTVPAVLVLLLWLSVRFAFLAVPALVLERITVPAAVVRSFRLSRGQTWRLTGILLATMLLTQAAAGLIGFPVSAIGAIAAVAAPEHALVAQVLSQAAATVVGAAFTTPFIAAVGAFAYLDQRIRKEAFDVELLARAGQDLR